MSSHSVPGRRDIVTASRVKEDVLPYPLTCAYYLEYTALSKVYIDTLRYNLTDYLSVSTGVITIIVQNLPPAIIAFEARDPNPVQNPALGANDQVVIIFDIPTNTPLVNNKDRVMEVFQFSILTVALDFKGRWDDDRTCVITLRIVNETAQHGNNDAYIGQLSVLVVGDIRRKDG